MEVKAEPPSFPLVGVVQDPYTVGIVQDAFQHGDPGKPFELSCELSFGDRCIQCAWRPCSVETFACS